MTVHDAAYVAFAVAALVGVLAWMLTKMKHSYVNWVGTWASFAFMAWGAFVLISTVLARS